MKTRIKRFGFKKTLNAIAIGTLVLIALCYVSIELSTTEYIYDEYSELPYREVGLVLGTSKRLANGSPNPYFYYRIKAAHQLYKSGKVKYLLLSGDNHSKYYNEPLDMKKALVEMGIPSSAIVLDFAGFRTLDSVVRCNKVFGQNEFTIISQPFHNKRAVYLARNLGMESIAYNAKDVKFSLGLKVQAREVFARVKAMMDLHIMDTQPKFLGAKIQIAKK